MVLLKPRIFDTMKKAKKKDPSPTSVKLGKRKPIIDKIAEQDGVTPHRVILDSVDLYIEARKIK